MKLWRFTNKLFSATLVPDICVACKRSKTKDYKLCDQCYNQLCFLVPPVCLLCAGSLSSVSPICQPCKELKRPWQKAYSVFQFKGLSRELLHRLKFQGDIAVSVPLAHYALQEIDDINSIDLVTSVPLHWLRAYKRGYNQSELIARALSQFMNKPYRRLLKRQKRTVPQSSLSKHQRLRNLNRAFSTTVEINNANILLVDDVMTTGATLSACTKVLLKNGASSVSILTISVR